MAGLSPIAIVGMGGVFPQAPDLPTFLRNILGGAVSAREVPPGRWAIDPRHVHDPTPAPDKAYSLRACFVENFALDPTGLAVDAEVLRGLDPMHQMVLHVGRQAFKDAVTKSLDLDRVGVTLAAIALPTDSSSALTREVLGRAFEDRLFRAAGRPPLGPGSIGSARGLLTSPWNSRVVGFPAGLLATALGLGGGSLTLDAACASSLYAVKLACEELRDGRADAMLAGGVSRPECLYTQIGFSQLRALSPSGVCRPFDAEADGLVVGEGAGVVMLKRQEDALRDGDEIYGLIHGIGVSNDIAGSLLAADSEGQLRAMRQAYEQTAWAPNDLDLIECHGTGTPLGDAVEVKSLRQLWGETGWSAGQCALGSVKSMIGHLLTAAGAAGLLKTVLSMRAGQLPPSAGFRRAAASMGLDASPFRVQTRSAPWPRRQEHRPRRAAVSAFGFGGINAHLLLEEWDEVLAERYLAKRPGPVNVAKASPRVESTATEPAAEPIAIVGMGVHFGGMTDLREFQEQVLRGGSSIGERPAERWWGCERDAIGQELPDLPGGYIDSVAIELGAFRLPPNEIPETLPQQLLMLKTVAAALDDAGLNRRERRPDAGVLIGMGLDLNTSNYHHRWMMLPLARRWAESLGIELDDEELAAWVESLRDEAGPALNAARVVGALGGIIASRIAREFGFGGPSFAVSAEEASGLRALEVAMRALQRREINLGVAGAVDLAGDVRNVLATDAVRPFSRGRALRPFDAAADGDLPGEGACAVVLKRLSDALAAGDRIYGVVRGVGFAGGGALARPDSGTYRLALERAYADSGVTAASIGLLECHGSGRPDENSVEAEALTAFFGDTGTADCAISTTKPLIGDAGAAAGLASVVKAALCLYQEIVPPLPGYATPSKDAPWNESAFHMPHAPQYWLRDRADGPRRAGVSCMTLDGQCGHVVLEAVEHSATVREVERRQPLGARSRAIFAISGENAQLLAQHLAELRDFAASWRDGGTGLSIERAARTWHARHPLTSGSGPAVAIVARSPEQLAGLASLAARHVSDAPSKPLNGSEGIYYAPEPLGSQGQVAFVFPGSGGHFVGMGREILAHWPEIGRRIDAENRHLKSQLMPRWYAPWRTDFGKGWQNDAARRLAEDPLRMIMGQVAYGTVMSDVLCQLGIRPTAAIGYSLGETTSLFALGAWQDRDEMLHRMRASSLFQSELAGECRAARRAWRLPADEPVDWRVAVVNRPAEEVRQAVLRSRHAYLLITNAPDECVIGGTRGDVEDVIITLGCEAIDLEGASTVHCIIAREVEQAYRELHLLPTTPPPGIRFYSAAAAKAYEPTRESAAESILRQAVEGFDFTRVIRQAYDDGVRVFVEVGPQASCTRMIGKILSGRPHLAMSASAVGQDELAPLFNLMAAMVAHGVIRDLDPLYGGETLCVGHRVPVADSERRKAVIVPTGGRTPQPRPPQLRRRQATQASAPRPSAHPPGGFDREPAEAKTKLISVAPVAAEAPDASGDALVSAATEAQSAVAMAHDAYLRFSRTALAGMGGTIAFQNRILAAPSGRGVPLYVSASPPEASSLEIAAPPAAACEPTPAPAYPREMCMEFAVGSVARVLGPEFAVVDTYPVRVRLPDEPLMLVDRILSVEAEKCSLGSGRVVTEHDVQPGDWYLDGGCMPISITVEAGQADLFLCSYLGIDLAVQGRRAYRLLDATVEFHRGLPMPGEVVRYDIRIDRFVRQGDTYLFFFAFEGTVAGRPVLSMTQGCAGFFTNEEIRKSGGIIETAEERAGGQGRRPEDWRPLAPAAGVEAYDEDQVDALRRGDLAGCFGERFAGLALRDPVRLPSGRMRLVHRVAELNLAGGRFGLGMIRAEADIHPDDWFLTCHFVDDMVMPGTLMYECCAHTLRILLMRLGWVAEREEVRYEPVPGVRSVLRCRGPVTTATKVVTYEIHVKELGYGPEPYALADALMYADGARIVRFTDMSLKMTGTTRERIEALWAGRSADSGHAVQPIGDKPAPLGPRPAIFDRDRILAFAVGKPSEAFGEPYRPFDNERRIARLPGPPYDVLHRITEIETQPWKLAAGGWIEAQYDVPPDAWYFRANRQDSMPFAVLLEIALQPCGWLAAYKGSALRSNSDLSFRNLGGTATMHEEIFPDAGTLTVRVRMTHVSEAGGMIIEKFDMQVWRAGRVVYEGDTSFGFFSAAALAQQVGIRDAARRMHVPSADELERGRSIVLPVDPPLTPDDPRAMPAPSAALPAKAWLMVDDVDCYIPDGGPAGLGYIRGTKAVDPHEWFFAAHFYQDPVCPGSLGLEGFLQLLKVAALERWGPNGTANRRFSPTLLGTAHTWAYRGQIIPTNRQVEVEAWVTEVRESPRPSLRADGFLKVDGIPIYEMRDFGLELPEVDSPDRT